MSVNDHKAFKITLLSAAVCFFTLNARAQSALDSDSLISKVLFDTTLDNQGKSQLYDSLFQVFASENDTCAQVRARVEHATNLDGLGLLDSAMSVLLWAENNFSSDCDTAVLVDLYLNYTNVYISLEDFPKVDSFGQLVLDVWRDGRDDEDPRLAALNNLAISAAYQGDMEGSNTLFRRVYREARQVGVSKYVQRSLINMGTLKGMLEDLDSAYYFLNAAALEAKVSGDRTGHVELLINLANIDMDRENFGRADMLLDSAYVLANRRGDLDIMSTAVDNLATLRANEGKYKAAYDTLRSYTDLREEFLNEERVRAVADMLEKYESERKTRQIQQLELEKLDAQIENVRITNARNRLLFLGGLVLLLTLGLFSRLRYVRRSRAALQREKEISDGLLLNILPAAVAEELKEKGKTEARYYETATIMFSDFENFTHAASELRASELVNGINRYFRAFDDIITQSGIEKIKTIGDAYMAAGGIDTANPSAAVDVVRAALEIQKFVADQRIEHATDDEVAFNMRVGIHSGPVVAGIVGVKKFQYDLWGDTVNIASRMESTGSPGKVNISEDTYQLVKDIPEFNFTPRGLVDVKGKGKMQMYYVERAEEKEI